MPTIQPLAVHAPSLQPQVVRVSSSTCHDLSLFKDLLRQYRALDDSINMRLNRTTAQFRDQDRRGAHKGNVQDDACLYFWKELVDSWKRRKLIVDYCVSVVDQSMEDKRSTMGIQPDPAAQRRIQAALYEDEVKRNQVRNELVVEEIVRKRSLDAFRTRCKYFEPPLSDSEARKWWDAAQAR